jgi:GTPase
MKTQPKGYIPTIAIVGRPNTGKSTLFNRLARGRIAIVDDMPGVTRDRLYAKLDWAGMNYHVIDTGGWVPEAETELHTELQTQLELAVSEADAVIFLLDGKDGVIPADQLIAEKLRKIKKPVFFVVNKIDNQKSEKFAYEFYELGAQEIYPVSAEHGKGVAELLDAIVEKVPGARDEDLEAEPNIPRIAVIGKPNVGKSSLINRLLREERLLVTSQPGTTRDAVDNEVEFNGKKYLFIDTAGLRKKSRIDDKLERISTFRAIKALERASLILLVIDAQDSATDQDAKLAGLVLRRGRACMVLLNKWDLMKNQDEEFRKFGKEMQTTLRHINFAPVLPVSAKTGIGLDELFPEIDKVFEQYNRKITTGTLNRKLEKILLEAPVPHKQGRPLKLYYGTQTRVRPPTFVFFANHPEIIKDSFARFLKNRIESEFEFFGTPIVIEFRGRNKGEGGS